MSPWQFTFSREYVEELISLDTKYRKLFIYLVCGDDGHLAITPDEFLEISGPAKSDTYWIRVDRPRNKMYEVSGNVGTLSLKKPKGLSSVVEAVKASTMQMIV